MDTHTQKHKHTHIHHNTLTYYSKEVHIDNLLMLNVRWMLKQREVRSGDKDRASGSLDLCYLQASLVSVTICWPGLHHEILSQKLKRIKPNQKQTNEHTTMRRKKKKKKGKYKKRKANKDNVFLNG